MIIFFYQYNSFIMSNFGPRQDRTIFLTLGSHQYKTNVVNGSLSCMCKARTQKVWIVTEIV